MTPPVAAGNAPMVETRPVNWWLLATVALTLAGAAAVIVGVYMVGGVGWALIVAGAATAVGALTLLPT